MEDDIFKILVKRCGAVDGKVIILFIPQPVTQSVFWQAYIIIAQNLIFGNIPFQGASFGKAYGE